MQIKYLFSIERRSVEQCFFFTENDFIQGWGFNATTRHGVTKKGKLNK